MIIDIEQEFERNIQYEDKSQQYTIRVSEECKNRIDKLKNGLEEKQKPNEQSKVSTSTIVRTLVEVGSKNVIEARLANSESEKSKKSDVEKLQEEVSSLREQLQGMHQVVEKLCSDLGDTPKNV